MHLSRLAGEEDGAVVGRSEIPARVCCEGMTCLFCVHVLVCVHVKKRVNQRRRLTETHKPLQWSLSRSTALSHGAFLPSCGHMWDGMACSTDRTPRNDPGFC